MDLNQRRQHVDRVAASLGEHGNHIPSVDGQAHAESTPSSFAYNPEQTELPVESYELNIPHGAPSLFESAPDITENEEAFDGRIEQPSPLHPQELPGHALGIPVENQAATLEDKFAQAINNIEAPKPGEKTNSPEPVESLNTKTEPQAVAEAGNPVSNIEYTAQAVVSAQAPHAEHFSNVIPEEIVIEEQGVEDAGLGLEFMKQRQEIMKELEVN